MIRDLYIANKGMEIVGDKINIYFLEVVILILSFLR